MARKRRVRLSMMAALVVVIGYSGPASWGTAVQAQTRQVQAPPSGSAKLMDGLATLLVAPTTPPERTRRAALDVRGRSIAIDATASVSAAVLLADLRALGLTDSAVFGRMVSGRLPVSTLGAAAELTSLKFARPAEAAPAVGITDTQGDAAMGTDLLRAVRNIDGTGITVGTLSDSYNCLGGAAADVASNDLPAGVNVLDEGPCPATDEGRGMMQLIHDVAPGAQQAFHTAFQGQADFAQGILDLQAAGADIINDDVFYFAEPFYQDGVIAQAVDQVVNGGIPYFSAAGNDDRRAYESGFADSGVNGCGGRLHDFDPGAGIDTAQQITIPAGGGVTLSFQWDQPFFTVSGAPGSANNMDLCLLDNTNAVVASGVNNNVGGDPVEVVQFTNPMAATNTTFSIQLSRVAGANPGRMKYVDYGRSSTINQFATNSPTIAPHANAANAEAVGAAFYNNTPVFGTNPPVREAFSSAGGTPILFDTAGNAIGPVVRQKPRIVGPDGTNTTFFGGDIPDPGNGTDTDTLPNFFGTSAAAPHAAAFAALLLEENPALTPAQVYMLLETTAIDMQTPGFDFDTGFGLIQAHAVLGAACPAPPPPGPGAVVVAAAGLVTAGTAGDDVIYGTNGFDRIDGRGGNDTIFGQGGDDQLFGFDGNDTLCGGAGADRLYGGNGDDTLSGDLGNDDLAGFAGSDTLFGGLGVDRLAGGAGTDVCATGNQAGDQTAECP